VHVDTDMRPPVPTTWYNTEGQRLTQSPRPFSAVQGGFTVGNGAFVVSPVIVLKSPGTQSADAKPSIVRRHHVAGRQPTSSYLTWGIALDQHLSGIDPCHFEGVRPWAISKDRSHLDVVRGASNRVPGDRCVVVASGESVPCRHRTRGHKRVLVSQHAREGASRSHERETRHAPTQVNAEQGPVVNPCRTIRRRPLSDPSHVEAVMEPPVPTTV
jgi:hypothetical protein